MRCSSAPRSSLPASVAMGGRSGCRPHSGRRSLPTTKLLGWSPHMPDNVVDQTALAGSVPHDLSVITLFLQADTLVKLVMLLLLVASFWSWAVIFDKYTKL